MAHSAIHFSLGLGVATACCLPALLRAWKRGRPLARRFGVWILASAGLGIYAVIPALLRRAGLPEACCRSPWMNVFLMHPLIGRIWQGGGLAGPLLLAAVFALLYVMLLAAISRAMRLRSSKAGDSPEIAD